jgi:hypothetical protein
LKCSTCKYSVKFRNMYIHALIVWCTFIYVLFFLLRKLEEIHLENKSEESMLEITPDTVCKLSIKY